MPESEWPSLFIMPVGLSMTSPNFTAMPVSDSVTLVSCRAFNRMNVAQCIPLGLPPQPFNMPGSHPSRLRMRSARLLALS